ncbi:hypothetical protein MNBD_GAMMA19-813 [hydrothermal vent metagenome]|uniref:Uncharacterized protein n=1 Tax=hydrothermal vent metagenome TaxID=652676 RepID=A0A3B0ZSQ4_9ZZZZ
MATIRKLKSKKFFAEVRKLGQYKSKNFTTKVQAMSWAAETDQLLPLKPSQLVDWHISPSPHGFRLFRGQSIASLAANECRYSFVSPRKLALNTSVMAITYEVL